MVVRVPTADGLFWFKELCPALAFEAALTDALARLAPGCMPEVVAVDGARMLMLDAGRRVDKVADSSTAGPMWDVVVARYAELHISSFRLRPSWPRLTAVLTRSRGGLASGSIRWSRRSAARSRCRSSICR